MPGLAGDWVNVKAAAHAYQTAATGIHEVAPSATNDVVMAVTGDGKANSVVPAAANADAGAAKAAAETPSGGGGSASGGQDASDNGYGYAYVPVSTADFTSAGETNPHTYEYQEPDCDEWQPVDPQVCEKLNVEGALTLKWSHKTRNRGKTIWFLYDKSNMTITEISSYKEEKSAPKAYAMRAVSTLLVWSAQTRNAPHLKEIWNGN